jgi:hypothetical protein
MEAHGQLLQWLTSFARWKGRPAENRTIYQGSIEETAGRLTIRPVRLNPDYKPLASGFVPTCSAVHAKLIGRDTVCVGADAGVKFPMAKTAQLARRYSADAGSSKWKSSENAVFVLSRRPTRAMIKMQISQRTRQPEGDYGGLLPLIIRRTELAFERDTSCRQSACLTISEAADCLDFRKLRRSRVVLR